MSFVKLNGHPFGLHREVFGARHGDSFSTGRPVPEKASGETGPSTPPLIALLEAGKWTDYPEISGMSSQCIQESNKTLPAGMVQLGRLQYSHLKVSISTTGTVRKLFMFFFLWLSWTWTWIRIRIWIRIWIRIRIEKNCWIRTWIRIT